MDPSGVFGKILLPIIVFSLILLFILILVFMKLPIEQAEKMGSFLSGITSVGLICISLGSIYATIYVAKSINELSTEYRREDEYSERMIDVLQKMLAADKTLHKYIDEDRRDSFRDFDREESINNLMTQQRSYTLVLKYYCSKHPKGFNGLIDILDSFIDNPANYKVFIQIINGTMSNLLNE